MLYREVFGRGSDRILKLYGEVLVFSMLHDNDRIFIYGHFAVAKPDFPKGLKYYRYQIVILSFITRGGVDMYKAFNFILNVYAPVHRKRIKDAVEKLPRPSEKTGLSFATSEMFLNELDSQQDSQKMLQGDSACRKPSEPASNSQKKEMATIREHMQRQRKESEQDNERQKRENTELKEQLKQDREQSKQEMGKLKEQNERLLAKFDQERESSKQARHECTYSL